MIACKQQGAALVVAMLILSLVTVLAASMTVEHNFSIRRVSNQLTMQQAYSWARGGEAIAQKALRVDLQMDKDDALTVDHRGEFWYSAEPQMFPLDENGNYYAGTLIDLQGRFNINSLRKTAQNIPEGGIEPEIPFTIEQGIFMRLLQSFNDDDFQISYDQAKEITEAVVDYLDSDSNARGFSCGEDDAYYSIEDRQAHKVPNSPLWSVSELRLVCNLPVVLFEKLQSHVTVWPSNGNSTININTASVELLRSIFIDSNDVALLKGVNGSKNYLPPPPVSEETLTELIERLAGEGYTDFNGIKTDTDGVELWPGAPLGLHSDYFLLIGEVKLNDLVQRLYSVISREGGTIQFLARSTGGL